MKSETVPDKAAEVYQTAAREMWRADRSAGLLRLEVTSESMQPLLRTGDVVVVRPIDPRTLRPGEVVVVQRGDEWITHRLVTVDERGWHTHGDNTRYADEAARADQMVGRVIAIERADQTIDLQQPHWRAIDRRINRVQRIQLRLLAAVRTIGSTQSTRLTRGLAALLNWPFHVLVRVLLRL